MVFFPGMGKTEEGRKAMTRGAGRGNSQRNRRGRTASRNYVIGSPDETPVLRPLMEPLYDTEIYPAGGTDLIELFVNRTNFNGGAGGAKTIRDTNMPSNGRLAEPQEYDLIGFTQELFRTATKIDHDVLMDAGVFQMFFSSETRWLTVPDTKIPQGNGPMAALDGSPVAQSVVTEGWPHRNNYYSFVSPSKNARHIDSNETFKVVKRYPSQPTVPSLQDLPFTVYLHGVHYVGM